MHPGFCKTAFFLGFAAVITACAGCAPSPRYHSRKKEPEIRQEKPAVKAPVFIAPLKDYSRSRINSVFGVRRHPRYHTSEFHSGVDIEAHVGDEVMAVAPGAIIFAGRQTGYGKVIIIEHGGRLCSVYAHLSTLKVAKGEKVPAGFCIGYVGMTGNSTGAHLHFEVRRAGEAVDPLGYLP
jgi:murein DD-endopeptidase MepM/ murein hydrolase activator NlpD